MKNNLSSTNLQKCYRGKFSKISNTFLSVGFQGWNSQNAFQNIKQGRPWSDCYFRSSLIWVCTVCLGLYVSRHLVFEILELLLYCNLNFTRCFLILFLKYQNFTTYLYKVCWSFIQMFGYTSKSFSLYFINVPQRDKTCLRSFWQNETQTCFISYRD